MLFAKFLKRNTRHAAPTAVEEVTLFPSHVSDRFADMCQPSENDLSYEDALVDTQARLFFRADLDQAGLRDPSVTFGSVLSRIERHQRAALQAHSGAQRARVSGPALVTSAGSGFLSSLKRALAGALVTRIVPGGVALLFAVTVLGSDVAQWLHGESQPSSAPNSERANDTHLALATFNPQPEAPTTLPGLPQLNVTARTALLHPVEQGMKANERELWVRAFPEYFRSYKNSRSGPQ